MNSHRFSQAGIAALLTALLSVPIMGIQIYVDGPTMTLGWDTWPVVIAVVAVFFGQFFRDQILAMVRMVPTPNVSGIANRVQEDAKLRRYVVMAVIAVALIWPFFVSRGSVDVLTLALIYVMLGLGLNIVVGYAGLLDLGYVAFYAIGAYSYALLNQYFGLSFWVCLPLAVFFAAAFGFVLGFPVLRLRGDYLAIVTLGFGEIIRLVLNNWDSLTGGPDGIGNIPKPTLFGLEFSRRASEGNTPFHEFFGIEYSGSYKVIFLYLLAVVLVVITLYVINRLVRMPVGRAWEALREDEIACRSLGLNPTAIKLSAFTLGASFGGFAGAFFSARQGFINPESFTFIESAIVLAIVVLGGMGSQIGVILAAIALTVLPEVAREFGEFRMLIFGVVMVFMMVWRPQGLLPMKRPHKEIPS
jgi:branched-chain amino acid transport system permease protein